MNHLQNFLISLYNKIKTNKICPICNNSLLFNSAYLYYDYHLGIYYNFNNQEKILDLYINNIDYWIYPFSNNFYYVKINGTENHIDISNLQDLSINGLIHYINKYNILQ